MQYTKISEIYDANDQIRLKLKAVIGDLTEAQAGTRENDEGWTIREIVEHLAIVEDGMTKICARLLAGGAEKGAKADGDAKISGAFLEKTSAWGNAKVEAPERVHPTGTKSIAESVATLDENRIRLNDLRSAFETVECTEFTFPHPAFGDMSAHEWLALLGAHEARHISQIRRILAGTE
ncbi:MAG: DinB family protein [Acidobacteria bacterium]|nr:DinB family protein [Acidobacteriota bacterium]